MKIIKSIFLIASISLLLGFGEKEKETSMLTVNIEDIKTDEGYVLIILFKGEDGFPTQQDKAYAYDGVKVSNKKASFTFTNLPSGTYAIAALHDANSNGELDTNILGIPKEEFGASNDAKASFGPPKYQDAKFEVDGSTQISIKMRGVF